MSRSLKWCRLLLAIVSPSFDFHDAKDAFRTIKRECLKSSLHRLEYLVQGATTSRFSSVKLKKDPCGIRCEAAINSIQHEIFAAPCIEVEESSG